MTPPPERVYRKTETGQAALATRTAALTARLRTALILVNGREPLALLRSKVGPDAPAYRDALDAIEAKLATNLGPAGARRQLDGLWP